jgi:hypothetical protein
LDWFVRCPVGMCVPSHVQCIGLVCQMSVRKCMYRITSIALDWFVRCPVGNVPVFGVTSSALDWDVRCPVGNVPVFRVTSSALDWDVRCPVENVFPLTSVFPGSVRESRVVFHL